MEHLENVLIATTLIPLAAWLLCRWSSKQIAACDFIWRTALILVALSPVIVMTRGGIIGWQWEIPLWPETVSKTTAPDRPRETVPFFPPHSTGTDLGSQPEQVPAAQQVAEVIPKPLSGISTFEQTKAPTSGFPSRASAPHWSWMQAGASLWLAGTFAHLVALAVSVMNGSRWRKNSVPVNDAAVLELVRACADHVALPQVPELSTNPHLTSPVVLGLQRSQIVVPPALLGGTMRDDLRSVLLHECGHLRRADLKFELLLRLILAAFWPHPLIHLMAGEIRRLREEMCDNYVLNHESPVTYAETLLRVAIHQNLNHGLLLGIGVLSKRGRLEQRVSSILSADRPLETRADHRLRILFTCGSIGLVGIGLLVRITPLSGGPMASDSRSLAGVDSHPPLATKEKIPVVTTSPDESRQQALEKAIAAAATNPVEIIFRIVDSKDQPVAGAQVTPGGVASFSGAFWGSEPQLWQSCESDLDGFVRFSLPRQLIANAVALNEMTGPSGVALTNWDGWSSRARPGFPEQLRKLGIHKLYLKVDHPQYPVWWNYLEPGSEARVTLAEPYTLIVKARREGEQDLARRVVPRLTGSHSTDWSEEQGIVTYRRVDLTNSEHRPSIQLVHFPEQGPAWFSDVIDLKHLAGNPITLDATLRPGVSICGQLAAEVPRPVKNGKVWGKVIPLLGDRDRGATWSVAAEIAEDGTFTLDSLPSQQTLQFIALCDGWSSQPPTQVETKEFKEEHHFPEGETGFASANQILPRLIYVDQRSVATLTVPMMRTTSCVITAVDELNRPVPGVKVQFNPNQVFHHWGSTMLGTGQDDASVLLQQLVTGRHEFIPPTGSAHREYSGETDLAGKVTIAELPCAAPDAPPGHEMASFLAIHENYVAEAPGMPNIIGIPFVAVRLTPGMPSTITLKMVSRRHMDIESENYFAERLESESLDPSTLMGEVVDSQGHPIEGVQVLFGDEDCFGIRSDAGGQFQHRFEQEMIDDEVNLTPLPLRFVKAGFAPATALVQLGVRTARIQLQQDTWFEGMVRKPDGTPAANVPVIAFHEPFHGHTEYGMQLRTTTNTNSEGRYRLLVEPAAYRIIAGADASAVAWLPARTSDHSGERSKLPISLGDHQTLDIQLEAGVHLSVQFLDQASGKPITSAQLIPDEDLVEFEGLGKADERGIASYPALPAGLCHFQIDTPQHFRCFSNEAIEMKRDPSVKTVSTDAGLTFNLQPGMEPLRIYCERGIEVSGMVTDPEGSPVANADVSLANSLTNSNSEQPYRHRHRTNSEGQFQFLLPPSGPQSYVLIAEQRSPAKAAKKWSFGLSGTFQLNDDKPVRNLEILLTEAGSIRGRVIDRQGNPIAQTFVQATLIDLPDLAEPVQSTTSRRDGTFELNGLRPGRYWLHGPTRSVQVVAASHLPEVEVNSNEVSELGEVEIPFNDSAKSK